MSHIAYQSRIVFERGLEKVLWFSNCIKLNLEYVEWACHILLVGMQINGMDIYWNYNIWNQYLTELQTLSFPRMDNLKILFVILNVFNTIW